LGTFFFVGGGGGFFFAAAAAKMLFWDLVKLLAGPREPLPNLELAREISTIDDDARLDLDPIV
jgi:hypothetical protein